MSFHDALHPRARRHGRVDVSVTRDQTACVVAIGALAQQEEQLPALAGLQHASNLERRARIQRRAELRRRVRSGVSAAGCDRSPLRPMNDRRSAVNDTGGSLAYENAT